MFFFQKKHQPGKWWIYGVWMGSLNGDLFTIIQKDPEVWHMKRVFHLLGCGGLLVIFGWLVVNDFSAYQGAFRFFTYPKYVSAFVNYSIFCIKSDWILLECCFKWNFSALASKVSKSLRTSQEVTCVNGWPITTYKKQTIRSRATEHPPCDWKASMAVRIQWNDPN